MLRSFALRTMSMMAALAAVAGCHARESSAPTTATEEGSSKTRSLEIPLEARSGSSLTGQATFTEMPDGVRVVADISGVPPGKLAVHVHEKGDCSSPDAMSTGDHFNPDQHPHGLPPGEPRHIGDFGNLEVGPDGRGHLAIVALGANLREGDAHSFLGRALVVHAKTDDGSQPSGNAGARIGCGEIRAPASR